MALRRTHAPLALLGVAGAWLACQSGPTDPSIAAPPLERIALFFPMERIVYGRGFEGAIRGASHAVITVHPSVEKPRVVRVEPDGSFAFNVGALSGNVVEIAGSRDDVGDKRGASTFLRVPKTPTSPGTRVCCFADGASTGICQSKSAADDGQPCPVPVLSTPCASDDVCAIEELLRFDLDRVTVTAPRAEGLVDVRGAKGALRGLLLVRVENRGRSSIGDGDIRGRWTQLSNLDGSFAFDAIPAQGDDELVLEAFDLLGFTTPPTSLAVPDADYAGVEVFDVIDDIDAIARGQTGAIGLRVAPFGIDGVGLCPSNERPPELCEGGGLSHDMVRIASVSIAGHDIELTETTSSSLRPFSRGTEGDLLGGPLDIAYVVDMSSAVAKIPDAERRLSRLADFIDGARDRDRAGLVTYGEGGARREVDLVSVGDGRSTLTGAIRALANRSTGGDPDAFGGVVEAAEMLRARAGTRAGRIVVMPMWGASGNEDDFARALDAVRTSGNVAHRVHVVGVNLDDAFAAGSPAGGANDARNIGYLTDLARFTGGTFDGRARCANALRHSFQRVTGSLFGSFVLLYDVRLPEDLALDATLVLGSVTVSIDGVEHSTSHRSPLHIFDAARDSECPR